jgi:hypothetical protein
MWQAAAPGSVAGAPLSARGNRKRRRPDHEEVRAAVVRAAKQPKEIRKQYPWLLGRRSRTLI